MLNVEVYDADVHDFDIQHSLIDIRYLKIYVSYVPMC
jgi:hypothetical protein